MKKNPQHTGRRRAGGTDYLLTGKLKCGHCGRYMVGMSAPAVPGNCITTTSAKAIRKKPAPKRTSVGT